MNREPFRLALVLIPLALACFAVSSTAQAACLDGCNNSLFNVFQGDDALINNTRIRVADRLELKKKWTWKTWV
jgi:hypothetical protein